MRAKRFAIFIICIVYTSILISPVSISADVFIPTVNDPPRGSDSVFGESVCPQNRKAIYCINERAISETPEYLKQKTIETYDDCSNYVNSTDYTYMDVRTIERNTYFKMCENPNFLKDNIWIILPTIGILITVLIYLKRKKKE